MLESSICHLDAIFAILLKHNSSHPKHRELAKQAAKEGRSFLFSIFANIKNLNANEKVNFFRDATNEEQLLFISYLTQDDLRNPALCKLIVENISLVRLFEKLPTKNLIMLLKGSSIKENDLLHFLSAFRRALEQKILPTERRLLGYTVHNEMFRPALDEKESYKLKENATINNDDTDEEQRTLSALIDAQKKILTCKEPLDYFAISDKNLIDWLFCPVDTFDPEEDIIDEEDRGNEFISDDDTTHDHLANAPYEYFLRIIQTVENALFTPATLYAFTWQERYQEAATSSHAPKL